MIMIMPKPTDSGSSDATIVIQTVHGNRMSVSMDQLPYAARGRGLGTPAAESSLPPAATVEPR